MKKILLILFCMILLAGTVMAADYKFQNATPSDLMIIHGDTGNLTVTGDISTGKTGFFGWLGSLTNRITKLFVQDINFTGVIEGVGNITTTGNITADYLFGKGTYLTDVNDTFAQLSCGNEQVVKWNSTSGLWYCSDVAQEGAGDIDAVNTAGPYLTGGQTSGTVSLLLNETVLNATIDLRAVTSESDPYWSDNFTKYNDSWTTTDAEIQAAEIDPFWSSNYTAYNDSWSSTYNASYVPYTGATQNVDLGSKNITASWFKGIFDWIIGATSTNYLSFNGTQLDFDESVLNATIDSRAVTSESDPLWSGNWTNVAFTNIDETFDENLIVTKNFTVDTDTLFVDSDTERVGIGTSSPIRGLEILGSSNVEGSLVFSRENYKRWGIAPSAYDSNAFSIFQYDSDGTSNFAERLMIKDTGNVGIGTTAPDSLLEVNGSFKVTNASNDAVILYANQTTGNVGIGTASPGANLHIYDSSSGSDYPAYLTFRTEDTTANAWQLASADGGSASVDFVLSSGNKHWVIGQEGPGATGAENNFRIGYMESSGTFQAYDAPSNFVITNDTKYVGINTADPQRRLHVAGDILANGTINATTDVCVEGGTCLSDALTSVTDVWVNESGDTMTGNLSIQANLSLNYTGSHLLLPQENDATTPTLAFGDGDTGFYQSEDNLVDLAIIGLQRWTFTQDFMGASNNALSALLRETPSSTNPNVVPARSDLDTGIGWAGADQLSLIAGGNETARAVNYDSVNNITSLVINPDDIQNNATYPSLAFGDGTMGFYQPATDNLYFATGGNARWVFSTNQFKSATAYGASLYRATSTLSSPAFQFTNDANTGMGRLVADQLSLIAGSSELLRLTNNSNQDQVIINPSADYSGNATYPSLAFGDGNTGFYEANNDDLRLSVGGTARIKFTTSSMTPPANTQWELHFVTPTSTVPTLSPYGDDPNTGIGWAGADSLSLIAGGAEVVRIFNTSTTVGHVAVNGTLNATGDICANGICLDEINSTLSGKGNVSGSGAANRAAFWTGTDTLSYDGNFTWDNTNKRLGIGTDSPTQKLEVFDGWINVSESTGGDYAMLNADYGLELSRSSAFITNPLVGGHIRFRVSGTTTRDTEVMRMLSTGNVGIGTTAPDSLLEVNGSFKVTNASNDAVILYANQTTGNVGIGTGSPAAELDVNGTFRAGTTDGGIRFNDDGTTAYLQALSSGDGVRPMNIKAQYLKFYTGSSTYSQAMRIDADGNVGINTTTPQNKLNVVGDANITGLIYGNGSQLTDVPAETLDGYDSSFFMPLNTSVYGQFDFNGDWQSGGVSIIDGNIFAQKGYFYNISALEVTTLRINGSLLPYEGSEFDNQFDVGSTSSRWRDLYLGGNAIINGSLDVNEGNLYVDSSSGNVGIGTTGPNATLEIINGTTQGGFMVSSSSQGAGDLFIVDEAGKVGIGDSTPSYNLDIAGNVRATGGYVANNNQRFGNLDTGGTVRDVILLDDSNNVQVGSTAIANSINLRSSAGTLLSVNGTTGNVGINTTDPQNTLNVVGDGNFTGTLYVNEQEVLTSVTDQGWVNESGDTMTGNLTLSGANLSLTGSNVQLLLPLENDATTPTLAFGDGDTGFYQLTDNEIRFSAGGVSRYKWDADELSAGTSTSFTIRRETASATNPVFVPRGGDLDTGIGWNQMEEMSLIAGSIEVARVSANSSTSGIDQFIISPDGIQNNATYPSLAFGDGDTGFYESQANEIRLSFGGGSAIKFSALGVTPASNQYWDLHSNVLPSATAPTISPQGEDDDTGIGANAADQLSLIANATEGLRINATDTIGNVSVVISPDSVRGSAAWPTLAFGDGDTGIYESEDDTLVISFGEAGNWFWTSTILGSNGAGARILHETPTSINPTLVPSNDYDTGMGSAGDDILSLIAGEVNAFNITESGGAITTDINGNLSVDTDTFFVDSDTDRVGIGTSAPDAILEIKGSGINDQMFLRGRNSDNTEIFTIVSGGSGDGALRIYNSSGSIKTFFTANGNSFINGGNVGIGTSSPVNKLTVTEVSLSTSEIPALGDSGGTIGVFSNNAKYGLIGGASTVGYFWLQSQRVDSEATAYDLVLQPTAGNVGIGVTTPDSLLEVNGSFKVTNASNDATLLYVNQTTGNVGIGTTSPVSALDVRGTIENGLVAWWTMDDNAASTTVKDHSRNSNHGTFNDTGGDPNTDAHSEIGKVGRALEFDGVDDYVTWTTKIDTSLLADGYSGFVWINNKDTVGLLTILGGGFLEINGATGELESYDGVSWKESTGTVTNNQWTYVGLVCNNVTDVLTFYINGVNDSSQSYDCDYSNANRIKYIGSYNGAIRYLNGSIDQAQIWDRALSEREISELYKGGSQLHGGTIGDDLVIEGDLNVSGDLFVGGVNLTGDFVPYTGATKNVDLGDNNFTVNATTLHVDVNTGRVGIGTSSPSTRLSISQSSSSTKTDFTQDVANAGLNIVSNYVDGNYNPGIFWSSDNTDVTKPKAGIYTKNTNAEGSYLYFGTSNSYTTGITNDAMVIDPSGNVGIGTSTPQNTLNVIGDGNFTTGVTIPNDQTYKFGGDDFIKYWATNNSVAVGKNAGADTLSSTFIGDYAGGSNTGTRVVAIGSNAGASNTGDSLTALGTNAGRDNTGSSSTFIGWYSGRYNSANYALGLGAYAGYNNTGEASIGIGNYAGKDSTAAQSIFIGQYAGIDGTGTHSIGIGYQALRENTGANSIAIGYNASYQNTDDNQFILRQADVNPIPLIQGNFSSGYLGIGTTSPSSKLEVNGTFNATSNGGSLRVDSNGNIMIGI